MIRADMISTVGREYLTSNIENDEYSYPKAFAAQSLTFNPIDDIEFASKTGDENNVSIGEKLFSGNALCVTNNGSVGCAFFQPTTFTCSHDVNPLYILDGCFNMYNALFVATVIEMDKYRWAYGRKWRPERMIKSTIRLPAKLKDDKYVPDWDYMENYIKSLPYGDRI